LDGQSEFGIELAGIERWLLANDVLKGRGFDEIRQLAGGTQNIVLRFSNGGRGYVLRHPPAKPRPNSNKLLEREIRLLTSSPAAMCRIRRSSRHAPICRSPAAFST